MNIKTRVKIQTNFLINIDELLKSDVKCNYQSYYPCKSNQTTYFNEITRSAYILMLLRNDKDIIQS